MLQDVRTEEEYCENHIPDAINIPNETIGSGEIKELPDKDQLILVYCRSGNRSKQAAEKLTELGYTNIVEFGGINDWTGETGAIKSICIKYAEAYLKLTPKIGDRLFLLSNFYKFFAYSICNLSIVECFFGR